MQRVINKNTGSVGRNRRNRHIRRGGCTICAALAVLLLTGCSAAGTSQYAWNVTLKHMSAQADEESTKDTESAQKPEGEASVMKYAGEYGWDFGPVSLDLSDLPPIDNKMYAAWDGKIYFRQYSNEDTETGALWGLFGALPDTGKELMCMDAAGVVTQVGMDYGCEGMYIAEGRIYSQIFTQEDGYRVYSCALNGSDVKSYGAANILAVQGSRVICQMKETGLSFIDACTGQEQILTQKDVTYLGADEQQIFYYGYEVNDATGTEEMTLYAVDYAGSISTLRMFPREEYIDIGTYDMIYQYPLTAQHLKIVEDTLYFTVGSHNGNAYVYSGGPIYSMKRDGSDCRIEAVCYETFYYLYDDGTNRVIYYYSDDERYGESIGNKRRRVTLRGEAPYEINPWIGYLSYDEPYYHADSNTLLCYPDMSGICYGLLTIEESRSLSIAPYIEGSQVQKISDIEYVEDRLFFTVTEIQYNPEKSTGWREYYDRGGSTCYCKDLKSGDIRVLYEY